MAYISQNKNTSSIFDEEELPSELGAETEAEKQMKVVLEKQLNKSISIQEQFSQHRTFVTPSTYKPVTELIKGSCSFEEFKSLEQEEELHQELQRCGLSDAEIKTYMDFKTGKGPSHRLLEPAAQETLLRDIEAKIRLHESALSLPQSFRSARQLSRHAMELERSLYAGCARKERLRPLVAATDISADEVFDHVRKKADGFMVGKRRKRKKSEEEAKVDFRFDSNVHHVTVPLPETEVDEKRLSVEEIRNIPKFKDYQAGIPSQTLFLKNLHPKTTLPELRALLGRFEGENARPLAYKLCNGRMKGQAFVTFHSVGVAEKALQLTNGYVLRGRPVIIQFGRKT